MIVPDDLDPRLAEYIAEQDPDTLSVDTVIVMWSCVDAEGDSDWNYRTRGDLLTSRVIGLIEMCKHRMLAPFVRQGLHELDDDEDEDHAG